MRAIILITVLLAFMSAEAYGVWPPPIMRDCETCHVTRTDEMPLREPLSGLCTGCHPDRVEADHKVDIVPSMDVGELPLDKDGRMTCVTCHNPHDRGDVRAMLRVAPEELCGRCHVK